jgi:hypothetical protein
MAKPMAPFPPKSDGAGQKVPKSSPPSASPGKKPPPAPTPTGRGRAGKPYPKGF